MLRARATIEALRGGTEWWRVGAGLLVMHVAWCSLAAVVGGCANEARPVQSAAEHNRRAEAGVEARPLTVPPPAPDEAPPVRPPPTPPPLHVTTRTPEPAAELAAETVPHHLPHLDSFYAKLADVRAGRAQRSVRILWLGDSHTAADFLTDVVRQHLAQFAGDGGPGFVRLGLSGYRHGAVTFEVKGKVRKAPVLPAQRTRVLDGVFGYGGVRTLLTAGAMVKSTLAAPRDELVTWTLSYRLSPDDSLLVGLGETQVRLEPPADGGTEILQHRITGQASDEYSIRQVTGQPQLFGAYAEYEKPGVVLDTVGINGARLATALAWEPSHYAREVALRQPDLVVLAFGTNEIFDRTDVSRYQGQASQLITLLRAARPELPCWIVGPPDAGTSDGRSRTRVAQVTDVQRHVAEEMDCAFTSQFELMGGEGSFARWMSSRPSKARGDFIHLTVTGYRELGETLAQELLPVPSPGSGAQSALGGGTGDSSRN